MSVAAIDNAGLRIDRNKRNKKTIIFVHYIYDYHWVYFCSISPQLILYVALTAIYDTRILAQNQ